VRYPIRGEVWLVDLGMAAKIRPCVVLSAAIGDVDRALITLVPHTTSTRETQFEAEVEAQFLQAGAFDAQGLITVPAKFAIRRLGILNESQMKGVGAVVCKWLQLSCE
jgi:mRNA interferase MazF